MLPVLKMASVHNVELVKFFFKLLYQADTQKPEVKGIHTFYSSFKFICNISENKKYTIQIFNVIILDFVLDNNSKSDRMYHMEMVPISERTEAREHFAYLNKLLPFM